MADIQAMFNATRPWLLLITVITDKRSNFLSAISFDYKKTFELGNE